MNKISIDKRTIIAFSVIALFLASVVVLSIYSSVFSNKYLTEKINKELQTDNKYNSWQWIRKNGILGYATNAENCIYLSSSEIKNYIYRIALVSDKTELNYHLLESTAGFPYSGAIGKLAKKEDASSVPPLIKYFLEPYLYQLEESVLEFERLRGKTNE